MVDLDPRDRDGDRRELDVQWVQVGRGSSSGRGDEDASEHRQDPRDREREARDRTTDPRDVFAAHLELPRSQDRELVLDGRDRYELNRDDVRTLATVGAFRVVPERQVPDARENSLRHLRDEGLVRFVSVNARERVLTLTERGRRLLESHRRDRDRGRPQGFCAGVSRMRELSHDAQLYGAYPRGGFAGNSRIAGITEADFKQLGGGSALVCAEGQRELERHVLSVRESPGAPLFLAGSKQGPEQAGVCLLHS